MSWFARVRPQRKTGVRGSRLAVQQLEQRDTPAGVVTVSVVGGILTLTGDNNAAGNQVRLLEQTVGSYDVQGQSGTQVKLAGGSPVSSVGVSGVTADIKATFFDGPDSFILTTLNGTPLRDMFLTMGKGNDTVNLGGGLLDVRNVTVSQGVGDTGNDNTTISSALGNNGGIRGSINVMNGDGSDTTTLSVKAAGNVTVLSAKGGDTTSIEGASYIGGSVTVSNTTGAMGNDTRIQGTTHISKNLSVTNGDQESFNAIQGSCVIAGNVTFKSGNAFGGTTLNGIDGALIGGTVNSSGTGGQSQTDIDGSRIAKSVTITSGPGNASDTLSNSIVGGSYISNKGAGNDSLFVANSTVFGNLTLNFGSSTSNNTITLSGLTALGTTTITGAVGDERVFIDDSRFIGAVSINTGVGVDVVEIGLQLGANTFFYGNLTVALGAGADQLRVGVNSDIRVSGNTLYSGILGETLLDDVGPFANVYLGTRKVS